MLTISSSATGQPPDPKGERPGHEGEQRRPQGCPGGPGSRVCGSTGGGVPRMARLPGTLPYHRGSTAPAYRRTPLPAFGRGPGRDGAELDVHLTADGRLAVFHDGTFPACAARRALWRRFSDVLRELRLAGNYGDHSLLEEVVPLFAGKPGGLIVELKAPEATTPPWRRPPSGAWIALRALLSGEL